MSQFMTKQSIPLNTQRLGNGPTFGGGMAKRDQQFKPKAMGPRQAEGAVGNGLEKALR